VRLKALFLLLSGFILFSTPGFAHHSFAAHFIVDEVVEFSGTVTKFYWRNPHAFIFLDVENEAGEIEEWRVEMSNTIGLTRRGWNKNTIAVGDKLHITGNPARVTSRHMAHIKTLKRESDGFEYTTQTRQ